MRSIAISLLALLWGAGAALANHPSIPNASLDQRKASVAQPAQVGAMRQMHVTPRNSANDVYVYGEYVGTDPDPLVRLSLEREHIGRSSD